MKRLYPANKENSFSPKPNTMRIRSLIKERKRPISIFFSYASEDEALQQQLESHLSIFRQNEAVSIWHKRAVYPGEDWQGKVHEGIVEADVILLLASADYVKSDYLWQHEMLLALRRHERGEALVAPVLLRPLAGLEEAPFGNLQPLPLNRKPATSWATLDEAFSELTGELITLLERKYAVPGAVSPIFRQRYNWRLTLDGAWEEFSPIRRREIELGLWKLTGDPDLEVLEVEEGSIQLSVLSSEATYEKVKAAYKGGILEEKLAMWVMALSEPIGASIRIETKIVGDSEESVEHASLAEVSAALPQYPALLTGFAFNSQNPFSHGFILGHPRPDELGQQQSQELQKRMGEYLNTFLVVRGEDMHVDLNPYKDFCGIPEPLRKTRLGWDLLRQDLGLKRFTTQLLHPGHETGGQFWKELLAKTAAGAGLESCFKVWITPGGASVYQKQEGDAVQVDITGFNMKVSCDFDYQSAEKLRKNRAAGSSHAVVMGLADEHALAIFKEAVLPRIQAEVDQGDTFGLLRQIYTVLICAKWYKDHIGGQLSGFIDSNDTGKYGLDVVEEDPRIIQREYQRLFEEGAWAETLPWYDKGGKQLVKRQFVVGRIELVDEYLK